MGTPEFAVPSLEALVGSDDTVVGVVTQPDRPKGRGQVLTPPPVKVVCQREGLPFLQPTKMKAPEFLDALQAWAAERGGLHAAPPELGSGLPRQRLPRI